MCGLDGVYAALRSDCLATFAFIETSSAPTDGLLIPGAVFRNYLRHEYAINIAKKTSGSKHTAVCQLLLRFEFTQGYLLGANCSLKIPVLTLSFQALIPLLCGCDRLRVISLRDGFRKQLRCCGADGTRPIEVSLSKRGTCVSSTIP